MRKKKVSEKAPKMFFFCVMLALRMRTVALSSQISAKTFSLENQQMERGRERERERGQHLKIKFLNFKKVIRNQQIGKLLKTDKLKIIQIIGSEF